jgi:hypothetical protein
MFSSAFYWFCTTFLSLGMAVLFLSSGQAMSAETVPESLAMIDISNGDTWRASILILGVFSLAYTYRRAWQNFQPE